MNRETWNDLTLGYLAGIIDADGYIGTRKRGNRIGVNVSVKMSDKDTIQRLHDLSGIGQVHGPFEPKGLGSKPMYHWDVNSHGEAARLLLAIYPMISSRRQLKISEAADLLAETVPVIKNCKARSCNLEFKAEGVNRIKKEYCSRKCYSKEYWLIKKEG